MRPLICAAHSASLPLMLGERILHMFIDTLLVFVLFFYIRDSAFYFYPHSQGWVTSTWTISRAPRVMSFGRSDTLISITMKFMVPREWIPFILVNLAPSNLLNIAHVVIVHMLPCPFSSKYPQPQSHEHDCRLLDFSITDDSYFACAYAKNLPCIFNQICHWSSTCWDRWCCSNCKYSTVFVHH